ncbi:MAG: hypothetical protein ACOYLO_13930 [Ferruginibacter sp.]
MQYNQKKSQALNLIHLQKRVVTGCLLYISLLLPVIAMSQSGSGSAHPPGSGSAHPPSPLEIKGFAQTKIPVFDNCALGMLKSEYFISLLNASKDIKTAVNIYPLESRPTFYFNKLFKLKLNIRDIKQNSDFSDLPAYFIKKYGEPDYKNIKDTVQNLVSEEDSLVNKMYALKQITLVWELKYYSINLLLNVFDLSPGIKKANGWINYTGNSLFYELLKDDE